MSKWENNEEIQIFREYLQIPTVHPNVDYGKFHPNEISNGKFSEKLIFYK